MIPSHRKNISEALRRNPVHPFPARMAPGIALDILSTKKKLRVLDPMMGSGTVIAVARSRGHHTAGIDIDPLAVLLSKVWTTKVDIESARKKARDVLEKARVGFRKMDVATAYPRNADEETRKFIRYWFDSYARRQLACLATSISRVRDESIRNVLWCGFSRLIITKQAGASLALDLAHSRPHKVYKVAPVKPFRKFAYAVEHVTENCVKGTDAKRGPAPRIYEGDARKLSLRANYFDLVLTSPPYLNAIDYVRCSKFSLVWMGYGISELRQIRSGAIGTEVGAKSKDDQELNEKIIHDLRLNKKLSFHDTAVLNRYISDMRSSIAEVARVLIPGGKAVYVVGENTVHGTFIRNSKIVEAIATTAGLRLSKRRTRKLPANRRYLPPPRKRNAAALDARMRREVILAFRKPRPRSKRHGRTIAIRRAA